MVYVTFGIIALVALCCLTGALLGLMRGLKKSVLRLLWIVACIVLVMIFSGMITPMLFGIDFSFLNVELNGIKLTTIDEYLVTMVSEINGMNAEQVGPVVDLSISLARMLLGGIICFVFFFILQLFTFILYGIENLIFRVGKTGKKKRMLGSLVGFCTGILVAITIMMPITGYITTAKSIANGLDKTGDEQLDSTIETVKQYCDEYDNNFFIKIVKGVGIEKLQLLMFKSVSTVKINNKNVSLVDEANDVGKIYNGITYLKGIDFNGIMDGTVTLDKVEVVNALSKITDSELIMGSLGILKPMIVSAVDQSVAQSEMAEYKDAVMVVVDEMITGITQLDDVKLKKSVDSFANILEAYPTFTGDIDKIDFVTLGESFDGLIQSGLVSNNGVSTLVNIMADNVIKQDPTNELVNTALTNIKTSFKEGISSYKAEFTAVDKLIDIMPLVTDADGFQLETEGVKVGKILDDALTLNTKVVNEKLITDLIVKVMEDFIAANIQSTDMLYDSVVEVKNSIAKGGLKYENEFKAITELMTLQDRFTGEIDIAKDGVVIGSTIDRALLTGSKVVTKTLINNLIKKVTDEVASGIDSTSPLKKIITDVKDGFNDSVVSYKKEFESFGKLLSLKDSLNGEINIEQDGTKIGRAIDDSIKVGGTIITSDLINTFIIDLIDSTLTVPSDNELYSSIEMIKKGFKGKINSYEKEFTAVSRLMSVKNEFDKGFSFDSGASTLGRAIDRTIAVKAQVVNKELINNFINNIIDNNLTVSESYGNIATIKERLSKDFSYEKEFGYIEKLVLITKNVGSISISTINKKHLFPGEKGTGMTIGERLNQIAPSVLCGDMGLTAIEKALESYKNDGANAQFAKIMAEVTKNFAQIKGNVKVCGKQGKYQYSDITTAFGDLYGAINDSSSKITGNDKFDKNIAENYENTLNKLQANIILNKNGTRALAEFVATEVKNVIIGFKTGIPAVDDIINGAVGEIEKYIAYISRTTGNLDNEELYNSEVESYAFSSDNFATDVQFTNTAKPGSVKINKPFSTVFEKISTIVP